MSVINNLIRYVDDMGWGQAIYDSMGLVVLLVQVVFFSFYRKKYGYTLGQALIALAVIYSIGYPLMLFLAWAENGFKYWGVQNVVRIFVYIPLVAIVAARILKVSAPKLIDFIAPSLALDQAIGHGFCPFAGCCHGYPCSWGIWNPVLDDILFPNQYLECIVAYVVFFLTLAYAKKKQYEGTGKTYALMLILFGSTRFLLEFLRDGGKLILGISNLAFHALFMVVVGIAWIMYLEEKKMQDHRREKGRT